MAAPTWLSISMIFSTDEGSSKVDVSRFSIANTTPSLDRIPTAVEPSFTASIAYSTWNNLPDHGERGYYWPVGGAKENQACKNKREARWKSANSESKRETPTAKPRLPQKHLPPFGGECVHSSVILAASQIHGWASFRCWKTGFGNGRAFCFPFRCLTISANFAEKSAPTSSFLRPFLCWFSSARHLGIWDSGRARRSSFSDKRKLREKGVEGAG